MCGELGLKPGGTRHRDVPTLLLSIERSGLHGGLDPVFHLSLLPSLSSGQHRPQLASGRPFPSERFASALSSDQELIPTPRPAPPFLFLVEAPLLMAFGGNSSLHPRQNPSCRLSCQSALLPLFWSIHHTVIWMSAHYSYTTRLHAAWWRGLYLIPLSGALPLLSTPRLGPDAWEMLN